MRRLSIGQCQDYHGGRESGAIGMPESVDGLKQRITSERDYGKVHVLLEGPQQQMLRKRYRRQYNADPNETASQVSLAQFTTSIRQLGRMGRQSPISMVTPRFDSQAMVRIGRKHLDCRIDASISGLAQPRPSSVHLVSIKISDR
jgi:hypothetical protein